MVHNNKILTVSYGTFSCTLEGFDDSFGTMKAIAEYFRDLASDDRYFGAEPPQPDVEMLARIAQREIARQVEAHSTDTGRIVLRASEPAQTAVVVVPEPAPEPPPEPTMESEVAAESTPETTSVAAPEVQEEEPEAPEIPEVSPETTEETTETITGEVAEVAASEPAVITPEPDEAPVAASELIENADAAVGDHVEDATVSVAETQDVADDVTPEQAETAPTVPETTPEPVATPDADEEPIAEPAPVDLVAQVESAPKVVPAEDSAEDSAENSIAAKLQRIRAVVSQNDSLDQIDDYTEDQHADADVAETAQVVIQAPDKDVSEDTEVPPDPDAQDPDSEVLPVLDQLDASHEDHEDKSTDDTEFGTEPSEYVFEKVDRAEDTPPSDAPDTPDTIESSEAGDAFFAKTPRDDDSALFDEQDDETGQGTGQSDHQPGDDTASDIPGDIATEQDTAVIKVKRADLEAAIATGQLVQAEDADTGADTGADIADVPEQEASSLSPEDEDDLMRELAAVQDELANDADDADNIFGEDIASDVADEPDQATAAHATLSQMLREDEADLSRLMAAADEKLEDPETSSSHETYSHLRGAVAAAEAERSAGGTVDDPSEDDAYRDDLANMVRPRRPTVAGRATTRRAADTRPAPLKLVAEQRVDDAAGLARLGPVRPRRVMAAPLESAASDATGVDAAFAEFAARMGATQLPDLLEAAAAYLSFVEGHEKFSRPQLMSKVRLIKQDDYNREDGLRSFGQLLRDGKIEKRGGGRFAASGKIRFRPDSESESTAREAG